MAGERSAPSRRRQQPRHRGTVRRDGEVGGDVGERCEDERALGEPGVGEGELRVVAETVAVEEQVEVERAVAPARAAPPPRLALEEFQHRQQRFRFEVGVTDDGAVEIGGTARVGPAVADGGRLVDAARAASVEQIAEALDRPAHVALAVAEVAADGDGDGMSFGGHERFLRPAAALHLTGDGGSIRRSDDPRPSRPTTPMRTRWIPAIAALCCLPSALPAQPPGPWEVTADRRLESLVERMRYEQEQLTTLEASFVQHKTSELLLEPEVARGVFSYAAPDRVRWEYREPNPISMLIDGDRMTTWYRDIDQVEEVEIGRHSQRVLEYLGAGSSLSRLLEYFDVRLTLPDDRSRPIRLDLDPRFERVARRISAMEIWVDPVTFLPIKLRYDEADGDVTEYEFSNYAINAEIPGDRFSLDIPSTVEVRTIDLRRAGLR